MRRRVHEKVKMYQLIRHTAEEFRTSWENIPKFVEAIQLLEAKLENLNLAAEKQSAYTLGVTTSRNAVRKDTIELSLEVAAALNAFAFDRNDFKLAAEISLSKSSFNNASLLNMLSLVDRVLNSADQYATDLIEYGISTEKMAEFHYKRDTLSSGILSPKQAILKRKSETEMIDKLVKEIDLLFKSKLDGMIKLFAKSDPHFFTAFQNARKVTRVVYHSTPNTDTAPEVDDGPDPF